MTWTRFMDMHSGGGCKEEPYEYIYIEAPEQEAISIFYSRFGHSPDRVSCTCCGMDYSVMEDKTLARATAFDRGCAWVDDKSEKGRGHYEEHHGESAFYDYQPLDDFLAGHVGKDILLIRADDIKPEERHSGVPEQGYVWRD